MRRHVKALAALALLGGCIPLGTVTAGELVKAALDPRPLKLDLHPEDSHPGEPSSEPPPAAAAPQLQCPTHCAATVNGACMRCHQPCPSPWSAQP